MNIDNRIIELLDQARRYDFTIVLSPASISAQLIDAGYILDPTTGEIVGTNDDWFTLTPGAELQCWRLLPEMEFQP